MLDLIEIPAIHDDGSEVTESASPEGWVSCRRGMTVRCRFAGYAFATAFVGILGCGVQTPVAAQRPESMPSGLCFEVVAANLDGSPGGAILLNRCSGQTWMLIRSHGHQPGKEVGEQVSYRWKWIATSNTQVATASPPPPGTLPKTRAPRPPVSDKCFNFLGRRYCE
jgi:hypothetical protein